jgi:transglutaminase-like putative cysteine protease
MKRKLFILLYFLMAFLTQNFAQEKPPARFGKISPADFKSTAFNIDSNASAVIMADIGATEMVDNGKGGFALEFKNYRRAHILNKNGYDIADVVIPLYTNGSDEEELNSLKAVTYNLENGRVTETKLEVKTAVFKDKLSKNWVVRKFTFPNIKEGSIIEYEYKVKSNYKFNLRPWEFQGEYPVLWSEYNVTMPEFYYYVTLFQGYQPFYIKDQKSRTSNFTVSDNTGAGASERTSFSAGVTDYRWVMKNVPALKEESFTSTISNHIAKIEFQLAERRYPLEPQNILGTWTQTSEELLKNENFGYSLNKENPWLNDVMGPATRGALNELDKAKNIYTYVRDNMTCVSYSATTIRQPLKNVLRDRNGNVAEINLLLVAMLRKAGLTADPVMLSTRSHGYTFAMYPLLGRFNYVIAQTTIGDCTWYLDASDPLMGFGRLGYKCYNGHARIINTDATPVEFTADSLQEIKVTSIFIINDENGNFSGTAQETPGFYESYDLRNEIKEKGKEQLLNEIKKGFNSEAEISGLSIDSLDRYDDPLSIKYNFEIKTEKEDIIYFNPMLGEGYKENPFKSTERFYPVEMPYTRDESYMLQLQIPQGYMVDELPKQIIVKLNADDDGLFEYRITESNGTISFRSRLQIRRSFFQPDEYEVLREFFNLVVKKHNEQIVFKKKK